jgi:hypothetical protein
MTDESIKVLRGDRTFTLSGRSSIGYQIGLHEDSNPLIRISENSGGGHFSGEWVSLESIYRSLEDQPPNGRFSSSLLRPLLRSRGANTPSFLMSALLHLGLVTRSETGSRLFQVGDKAAFIASLADLVKASGRGGGPEVKRAGKRVPKAKV